MNMVILLELNAKKSKLGTSNYGDLTFLNELNIRLNCEILWNFTRLDLLLQFYKVHDCSAEECVSILKKKRKK